MAARPDDDRALLPARGAPADRGQIVGHDLQRIENVVEILDLGDGPQSAQRGADGLADDRRLADAGVADAQQAVLFLQSGASLVDVAEFSDVLTEDDDARIAEQGVVETVVEDLEAVE